MDYKQLMQTLQPMKKAARGFAGSVSSSWPGFKKQANDASVEALQSYLQMLYSNPLKTFAGLAIAGPNTVGASSFEMPQALTTIDKAITSGIPFQGAPARYLLENLLDDPNQSTDLFSELQAFLRKKKGGGLS